MTTHSVVEHLDVFLDSRLGLDPGPKATVVDQLLLQCARETLHRGVVVALALARHGGSHPQRHDGALVARSTVLAASVRAMDAARLGPAASNRPIERRVGQLLGHPACHRVSAAMRRRNPDALLSTEAPVDLKHRHFNRALHQAFRMELSRALCEAARPMRVALPAYRLHTGAAGSGPSLRVAPLWLVPGADESPWLAVFAAVGRTINDRQIRSDPCATPDGVVCWHVAGDDEDVVIGVRPGVTDDESHRLRVSPDQQPSAVTVSLAYRPSEAWLHDLDRGSIRSLEWNQADGVVGFRADSCCFVAVFRRRSCPVPTWIDMPGVVRAGTRATLDISAIGHTAPVSATLSVPGLCRATRHELNVPGSRRLGVPAGRTPGWYRAELAGPGICSSVRLFMVTGHGKRGVRAQVQSIAGAPSSAPAGWSPAGRSARRRSAGESALKRSCLPARGSARR